MSTFDEYEESVQSSLPVEGYKFIGSFKTYRYTSADRTVVINGESYEPIAVRRARAKAGTQDDDGLSLDLTMPFDTDIAIDYAYSQTPPKLELEIYRNQQDDPENDAWALLWKGVVRGFTTSDRECTIKVPSIFSLALQGEIPNVYYQAPCNHVLYSSRCGAVRALNRFVSYIAGIESPLSLALTTIPTTNGNLVAGEVVNLRTGERRLIVSNTEDVIKIGYAFVDIQPGDEVELVRGCDHSLQACRDRFANIVNFGGFHYIPSSNPFQGTAA